MDLFAAISLLVGVIGTSIAIYQTAVINESKKRSKEVQYLLAGIGHAALSKHQAWINQLKLLPQPETPADLALMRAFAQARDDAILIHQLVSALEGTVTTDSSALTSILEKTLKQSELNNQIQGAALKNPTLKGDTKISAGDSANSDHPTE